MNDEIYFYSAIVYLSSLSLSFFFARKYEMSGYKNKGYLLWSFISVYLLCALRFFVGNDYEGFFYTFYAIRDGETTYMEFGYYLLNKLFSFSDIGYIYVFALMSFFTLFLFFKVFIRYKILPLGVFFLFTTTLLIMSNDHIRQGLAISIFFYSLK